MIASPTPSKRGASRSLCVLLAPVSFILSAAVFLLRPWEGDGDLIRAHVHGPSYISEKIYSQSNNIAKVALVTTAKESARNAAVAPSSGVRPSSDYTATVNALILEELGVDLATALYDPLFIDDASALVEEADDAAMAAAIEAHGPQLDPSSLYLTEQNNFTYASASYAKNASVPATMTTVGMQLACLKQAMSLGLGRLARDGRLAEGYERGDVYVSGRRAAAEGTADASRARKAYERPLRQVIRGFANYAVGYLQNTIDGEEGVPDLREWERAANNAHSEAQRREAGGPALPRPLRTSSDPIVYPHLDPMLILMQIVRTGPAAPMGTEAAVAATDVAAARILRQAGHLRGAAAKVLGASLGLGEVPVDGLVGSAPRRSNPKALRAYTSLLKEDLAVGGNVSGGGTLFSLMQRRARQPSSVVADAVLDVVGYASAVWANRSGLLEVIGAIRLGEGAAQSSTGLPSGPSVGAARGLFASRAHYALQYFSNIAYSHERGREGKFWNAIRPVVGCSGLAKQCEHADGCRYTCNFDYLLGAEALPPPSSSSSSASAHASNVSAPIMRYAHQAVGIGSNNQFGWELGMADAFKRAAAANANGIVVSSPRANSSEEALFALPNVLGRVTVFDCTLEAWRVPAFLSEGNVGFGHASYCFANKDSPPRPRKAGPRDKLRDTSAIPAGLSYTSLRQFINSDGLYPGNYEGSAPNMARGERAPNPYVRRFPTHPRAALNTHDTEVNDFAARGGAVVSANSGRLGAGDSSKAVPSPLYVDYATFDELAVFKIDVEWFEHSTFPNFARAELLDLRRHRRPLPTSSIYFDVDAPNTATYGQFQVELHRLTDKNRMHRWPTRSYDNSLRTHYVLMQLYAMGSAVFAQEKNPFSYCCYELALTHYRHFVRSEIWHSEK